MSNAVWSFFMFHLKSQNITTVCGAAVCSQKRSQKSNKMVQSCYISNSEEKRNLVITGCENPAKVLLWAQVEFSGKPSFSYSLEIVPRWLVLSDAKMSNKSLTWDFVGLCEVPEGLFMFHKFRLDRLLTGTSELCQCVKPGAKIQNYSAFLLDFITKTVSSYLSQNPVLEI